MGQLDVARMLIESGADLTTENMIGETPEKRLINSYLVTLVLVTFLSTYCC
jgi:hypothetical protein